jgi:hypothetical protein
MVLPASVSANTKSVKVPPTSTPISFIRHLDPTASDRTQDASQLGDRRFARECQPV